MKRRHLIWVVVAGACGVAAAIASYVRLHGSRTVNDEQRLVDDVKHGGHVRSFSEDYSLLTSDQRRVVDSIEDPIQKEFAARSIAFSDRITGDRDELLPFVEIVCGYGISGSKSAYPATLGNALVSFSIVSIAWAKHGPFEDIRSQLIDAAARCENDPDEVVRLQATTLLEVIATRPRAFSLPPHAERARQAMRQNEFVKQYLERDLAAIDASLARDLK